MSAETALYHDLAYVFVAAMAGGLVARKLRQPLILGYVAGGIVVGPFTPGLRLSDVHELELLAEIGVILLMYSIGIEFSIRDLLRVKWVALIGGPLGILLSILLANRCGMDAGLEHGAGDCGGCGGCGGQHHGVVTAADRRRRTAIGTRPGDDRHHAGGRFRRGCAHGPVAESRRRATVGSFSAVGLALGKGLLILAPVAVLAYKFVPPLMARVARMKDDELYLLVTFGVGICHRGVDASGGLSLALGAFLAGVVISGSEHAHETLTRVLPLRDAFVALFFVTIGALDRSPPVVFASLAAGRNPGPGGAGQVCDLAGGGALVPLSAWVGGSGCDWADPDWRVLVCADRRGARLESRGQRCL